MSPGAVLIVTREQIAAIRLGQPRISRITLPPEEPAEYPVEGLSEDLAADVYRSSFSSGWTFRVSFRYDKMPSYWTKEEALEGLRSWLYQNELD